jgi:hypothetical protein
VTLAEDCETFISEEPTIAVGAAQFEAHAISPTEAPCSAGR